MTSNVNSALLLNHEEDFGIVYKIFLIMFIVSVDDKNTKLGGFIFALLG